MKKRRSRGLGSSPSEHVERAKRDLDYAVHELREARTAKTCAKRADRAIDALRHATLYRAEMMAAGRSDWTDAALISREARDLIKGCLR